MDHAAHKVLESATVRALHAQNFARSSSQASLVLTDLLSRYLTLLSSTCAKYAQHAGRTRLMPLDVFSAMDELGVNMEELKDYYMTEGYEMNRYSIPSAHLNEFKTQLSDGLKQDTDDVIPLFYGPVDPGDMDTLEEEEEAEEDPINLGDEDFVMMDTNVDVLGSSAPFIRKSDKPLLPPPLPPSPVSNPSSPSPSRKRARIADWNAPAHVPSFLPPFPQPEPPPPSRPISPTSPQIPQLQLESLKIENQQPQFVTSSDYLSQVPYAESTLSAIPEWHLPQPPSSDRERETTKRSIRLPTPQMEPSFIKAYHHILTHPPMHNQTLTPSRHKIAMALLHQMQSEPRWEPPDTLFGNVAPSPPRALPVAPSHPIPMGKAPPPEGKLPKPDDKDPKLPSAPPRPVYAPDRMLHLVANQPSRIPGLARRVLPPPILARTGLLVHPPPLVRGTSKLTYGNGIAAPWNSGPAPSSNPSINGKAKEKDGLPNGKDTESPIKSALPDARMYATWEAEKKDYRTPLSGMVRGRPRVGSQAGGTGVTLSLNRGKRRDSAL